MSKTVAGGFYILVLFVLLSAPFSLYAEVRISEIMYDLSEGSDSGREWIEVFNNGPNSVLFSEWKFFENGTNHKLTHVQGTDTLVSGEYAVIVDNTEKFLIDWPNFSGILFDSSFSLSNAGETLALRDAELVNRDTVSYVREWGANGDGNSLQWTGVEWTAQPPTPGTGELSLSGSGSPAETKEETAIMSAPKNFPVEPRIFAFAGDDRVVTVGADTEFKGRAVGIEGEPLAGAHYIWNFGDGARTEGKNVLHHYRYLGTYQVVLDVSSGEYAATDRLTVIAREADIAITNATPDVITLANYGDYELNLSWWMLESGGVTFTLPEHTLILPEHEIRLPSTITELSPERNEDVVLKYPNGIQVVLLKSSKPLFENSPISHSQVSQQSIVGMAVPVVSQDSSVSFQDESAEGIQRGEQSAAVSSFRNGAREENKNIVPWILALTGVILLASASVIFLRYASHDDITIID